MQSEFQTNGEVLVLRLRGDVRLWGRHTEENELVEQFRGSLNGGKIRHVVLNLQGVSHLDTMGIATMVRLLSECTKHKVDMRIVMPSGVPGESLRRVRIFDAWPTYRDEPAAVEGAPPS